MMQKTLFLCLFIMFYESSLFAQHEYTFSQFADETYAFVQQPVKWDGGDYLRMGLITAVSGLTMFADDPIRDMVLRDQSYYESVPMVAGKAYGGLLSPIVFFSGFAVYSFITDDIKTRKIAYEIGQASIYGGIITYLLKISIGRARPNLNDGPATYRHFNNLWEEADHSFPGGHSCASFIISTVLARNVEPVWLKAIIYVPAVVTAASRVYQDYHWTSDCIFGAAMGYYIATWVVDQHEKPAESEIEETGSLMERIQIQPITTGETYGISLSIRLM